MRGGGVEKALARRFYLIGLVGRPSFTELRRRLQSDDRFEVHERLLSLVSRNADETRKSAASPPQPRHHSAGVHSLLIINPSRCAPGVRTQSSTLQHAENDCDNAGSAT